MALAVNDVSGKVSQKWYRRPVSLGWCLSVSLILLAIALVPAKVFAINSWRLEPLTYERLSVLVADLAWPATVIIGVIVFRGPLRSLIERLEEIETPGGLKGKMRRIEEDIETAESIAIEKPGGGG